LINSHSLSEEHGVSKPSKLALELPVGEKERRVSGVMITTAAITATATRRVYSPYYYYLLIGGPLISIAIRGRFPPVTVESDTDFTREDAGVGLWEQQGVKTVVVVVSHTPSVIALPLLKKENGSGLTKI